MTESVIWLENVNTTDVLASVWTRNGAPARHIVFEDSCNALL